MNLKWLFFALMLMQVPVYIALAWVSIDIRPWLFYASEVFLVVDIAFSIIFYRKVIRPVQTLAGGMNLLKSQDWNVQLLKVGQKETDALVDVFNDMMERLHNLRTEIIEQRHFLSLLVEAAPVGIVVMSHDGSYDMVNPASQKFMSSPAAVKELYSIPDNSEKTIRLDSESFRCQRRHFLDRGVRCSFFIIENITQPLDTAEKAAYGKVIRIIAHEVNNTVAGLTTAIDAVESDDREILDACGHRAMELSRFIGRFAEVVKIPEPTLEQISLARLVAGESHFLESICNNHGSKLEIVTSKDKETIQGDPVLLGQVLVNLVKNAAESAGKGGHIRIEAVGRCLTVVDDGRGITPEKATRIFTPFYTDKPGGQGIGLTFVRTVLTGHRASYSLGTNPDDGLTRFIIKF